MVQKETNLLQICKFFRLRKKGQSTGNCCFCDKPWVNIEVEPEAPTIEWVVVVKLIIKAFVYYYFYDFLFKVH